MFFRAKTNQVKMKKGGYAILQGPLVVGARRPAAGWGVSVRIKGVDTPFGGQRPHHVANALKDALTKNEIKFTDADIWLTLNLQWMSRLNANYFTVDQAALTAIISGEGEEASSRTKHLPEEWGSRAWLWLGLYLAQDQYRPEEFIRQCDVVLDMLNPSTNPTTGCIVCYTEWSSLLHTIRHNQPMTQDWARRWLWEAHNAVNQRLEKRVLTFEQAARANLWI